MTAKPLYEFGPYSLDTDERVLLREGQPVTLPPKDLETLTVLVAEAGHIVEKEELLEKVWPGVFVEEGNLARHIFNLRQVLGDTPDGRKYIETVPKRGYRFVAAVTERAHEESSVPQQPTARAPAAPQSATIPARRWPRLWSVVATVALVLAAVALSRYFDRPRNASGEKVMLAVLPFANLSGDAHDDYLAEGLTEEMIAQLGQLQPAKLGVIARTSTVRYKDMKETAAQIGRELGVGYLLEGSVRRGGERVRITAELVQAADQTHLWAENYERPVTDVLAIEKDIAQRVTHSLSIRLLPTVRTSLSGGPVNFESYNKYLLGLHELGQGTQESGERAIQYFQEAIAINPKDARLYAALGEAYDKLNTYHSSPTEMMPRAKAAAQQALELDPNLAGAHVLLGDVRLLFDWDWSAAESEYRHALELNPSLPEAHLGYATYLATLGHFDEALARVQQAYLFDPLAIDSRNDALWIYYFSGRLPETIEQCQKAIELEPTWDLPYAIETITYARMGERAEVLKAAENTIRLTHSPSIMATAASGLARVGQAGEARQLLAQALARAKQRYVCRFIVATTYADLGDLQQAMDSLEQGFLQRST